MEKWNEGERFFLYFKGCIELYNIIDTRQKRRTVHIKIQNRTYTSLLENSISFSLMPPSPNIYTFSIIWNLYMSYLNIYVYIQEKGF